jgi:hypothetical protein
MEVVEEEPREWRVIACMGNASTVIMYVPDCCIAQASGFCRYETALASGNLNELKHLCCKAIDQSDCEGRARAFAVSNVMADIDIYWTYSL